MESRAERGFPLSDFFVDGAFGRKVAMTRPLKQLFLSTDEVTHVYDFGTSSETIVKLVDERSGQPTTKHAIALMARNEMPAMNCIECDQPATHLCQECIYEDGVWGVLCDEHAADHPHEEYGEPMPLFNSPRMGMCGYDGPAEPPY
ncbi:MAG: hypothetical protein AAGA75_20470 [Cyanobacteria bacterium P01_E01_bin.6]